jgi:hypothetical protein
MINRVRSGYHSLTAKITTLVRCSSSALLFSVRNSGLVCQ